MTLVASGPLQVDGQFYSRGEHIDAKHEQEILKNAALRRNVVVKAEVEPATIARAAGLKVSARSSSSATSAPVTGAGE